MGGFELKTVLLLLLVGVLEPSVIKLIEAGSPFHHDDHDRSLSSVFEPEPLLLSYKGGEIFSGSSIPVYIIWYGRFSNSQRAIIDDFFGSFSFSQGAGPTVKGWWALTQGYKDAKSSPVASKVKVELEHLDDDYSMGRYLAEDHIEGLLVIFLNENPAAKHHDAFYLVLTAEDVYVEGFCTRRCASHFSTKQFVYMTPPNTSESQSSKLAFAWVGNSASQCPGKCAWPFAKGEYGLDSEPLRAPNGDVGVEGMIINIAAMLAGTATNPFNDGFFQGHSSMPLEAATACMGVFGEGAYSGYPGNLLTESTTGVSYNAHGLNNRKFLLPALWSPHSGSCSPPL